MPGLFERIVLNPMNKILRYIKAVKLRHLLSLGISRAAATAPLRNLDPCDPSTWEFRGLSQHGEDGIIEYLTAKLARPNRYFVEIGIGDGTENNTSWLAVAKCWRGLMVDGNALNLEWARYLLQPLNYGVAFRSSFVTVEGIQTVIDGIAQQDPDFFSLDIDGNDYWVAKALLKAGIRPKIWCVEYNSAFGPDLRVTIPYQPNFAVKSGPGQSLYFGCSIAAWRALMEENGYRFITAESCGGNAFFGVPEAFSEGFLDALKGRPFQDNVSYLREYGTGWRGQLKLIESRKLVEL